MSSNKRIREKMIQKYGNACMMEQANIRNIPVERRRRIVGYKKTDEVITYHHVIPKNKGGKTTEDNGVLLKWYNHFWLEKQPKWVKEQINDRLQDYKKTVLAGMAITGDGRIGNQFMMDFDDLGEYIEIPLYPNKRKEEQER